MKTIEQRTSPLRGEVTVPGDKSISHRAVMFGSIARGNTEISGFLPGADCLSTVDCFRRLRFRPRRSLYRKQRDYYPDHVGNTGSAALHISGLGRRVHIRKTYAQGHFAPVPYGGLYNQYKRE